MKAKMYLGLFFLCTILSQSMGDFSRKNNESTKIHIRRKRLLNRTPHEIVVSILKTPYIVNILENGSSQCAASILTQHLIITAAHCVHGPNERYIILSGSGLVNHGVKHTIVKKIIYKDTDRLPNDLALIVVAPSILIQHAVNRKIDLHEGPLPSGTSGTITGWGCIRIVGNMFYRPYELRSITVPIISLDECQNIYRYTVEITNKQFCTYDIDGLVSGSYGDSGGPFVVDGQLAGVYSWSKNHATPDYPDVYVNLAHPLYRDWILANMHHVGS